MNQADYAYGVAYIRSIENRLLDKGDIEALIMAKSPSEAVRMLIDKGYGNEMISPSEYETLLSNQQKLCWQTVREVAPKNAPLDILLYQNDFHNLKVVLKSVFTDNKNIEALFLSPAAVSTDIIIDALNEKDFSALPEMLREPARMAYESYAGTEDIQKSDIIIDKASMDYMMKAAKDSKNDFIISFVKLKNALADIKIAYRAMKTEKDKSFLSSALSEDSGFNRDSFILSALSGEDALLAFVSSNGYENAANALKASMAEFEKYADNALTEYIEKARYITFGVEPLLAYILKKQAELLSVRIIMSGKLNGFSEQSIRERLR